MLKSLDPTQCFLALTLCNHRVSRDEGWRSAMGKVAIARVGDDGIKQPAVST